MQDLIIARVVPVNPKIEEAVNEAVVNKITPVIVTDDTAKIVKKESDFKQKIRGSVSVNSYSDLSNTPSGNSQRFRYTFSLDAANIADSKFSFETYLSFKHKAGEWQDVKDNVFNALKVYSLSARYNINKSTQISLGRRINPRMTSIGAMDGIQFEKNMNKFSFGAVAGTRPDFTTYGFDASLFQFGAFTAFNTKSESGYTETSLAFMQQMNNSKTDRRFLYLQHSNTLVKNIYLFSTLEADLYQLNSDSLNANKTNNNLSLTGLYISLSYRPSGKLSFSGSYDARKNVIYYETYKTFVDRILENELRQGFRLQGSYRITTDLSFGVQAGYRLLKSDPHTSRNIYSYLSYNQIPVVDITATISATLLESAYLNGKIYSLNLSRDFFKSKVQTGLGYRFVDYRLPENLLSIPQSIAEANISWQMFDKMSLSISYEGTFEKQDRYDRIYFQIRKRF
ncbi:MAG: hypothetical protein IPH69_08665 [Bacteroidales bacterium]|nr:hypothetical protein [Bacteroidales bacterium]